MAKQPFDLNQHVANLRELIRLHMRPYNLGDMGETETAIEKLIEHKQEVQQSTTDAVVFADWIAENYINYDMQDGKWYHKKDLLKHISEATVFTTAELYKLFNPSGAAKQAAGPIVGILDEKGFLFIGNDKRYYWCRMMGDCPWFLYRHPDGQWVTLKAVGQMDVWAAKQQEIKDPELVEKLITKGRDY